MAQQRYEQQTTIQPTAPVADTAAQEAARSWKQISATAEYYSDSFARDLQQDAIIQAGTDAAQIVNYDANGALIPPSKITADGGGPIYRRSFEQAALANYTAAAANDFQNHARRVVAEFPTQPEVVNQLLRERMESSLTTLDPVAQPRVRTQLEAIRGQSVSQAYAGNIAQTYRTIEVDSERDINDIGIQMQKAGISMARLTADEKSTVFTPTEKLLRTRLAELDAKWAAIGMVPAERKVRIERALTVGQARIEGEQIAATIMGQTGPELMDVEARAVRAAADAAKKYGRYQSEARAVIQESIGVAIQSQGLIDSAIRLRDARSRIEHQIGALQDQEKFAGNPDLLAAANRDRLTQVMGSNLLPESKLALYGQLTSYRNPAVAAGYQDIIAQGHAAVISPYSTPQEKEAGARTIESVVNNPNARLALPQAQLQTAQAAVDQYRMAPVYAGNVPAFLTRVDSEQGISRGDIDRTRVAWMQRGLLSSTPGANQMGLAQFEAYAAKAVAKNAEYEKGRAQALDAYTFLQNNRLAPSSSQLALLDKHIPNTPITEVRPDGKVVETQYDGKNPAHISATLLDLFRKQVVPSNAKDWAASVNVGSNVEDRQGLMNLRDAIVKYHKLRYGMTGPEAARFADQFVESQLGGEATKLLRAMDDIGVDAPRADLLQRMKGDAGGNNDTRQAGGGPPDETRDRLRSRLTGESQKAFGVTTGLTGFVRQGFNALGLIGGDNLDKFIQPLAEKAGVYWRGGFSNLDVDPATADRVLDLAQLDLARNGERYRLEGKDRDVAALQGALGRLQGDLSLRQEKNGRFTLMYRSLEGEMANTYGRPVSQQEAIDTVLAPFTQSERLQSVDPASVQAVPYTAQGRQIYELYGRDKQGTSIKIGEVDLSQPQWNRRFMEARDRAITDLGLPGLANTLNLAMNGVFSQYLARLNAETRAAFMSGRELPKDVMLDFVHGIRDLQQQTQGGRMSRDQLDAFAKLEQDPDKLRQLMASSAMDMIAGNQMPEYGPWQPYRTGAQPPLRNTMVNQPPPVVEPGRAPSIYSGSGGTDLRPARTPLIDWLGSRRPPAPAPAPATPMPVFSPEGP